LVIFEGGWKKMAECPSALALIGERAHLWINISWISVSAREKKAALGRRSGNHCGRHMIPREISGNAGPEDPQAISLFIRL
jgi:hypothetical protein